MHEWFGPIGMTGRLAFAYVSQNYPGLGPVNFLKTLICLQLLCIPTLHLRFMHLMHVNRSLQIHSNSVQALGAKVVTICEWGKIEFLGSKKLSLDNVITG